MAGSSSNYEQSHRHSNILNPGTNLFLWILALLTEAGNVHSDWLNLSRKIMFDHGTDQMAVISSKTVLQFLRGNVMVMMSHGKHYNDITILRFDDSFLGLWGFENGWVDWYHHRIATIPYPLKYSLNRTQFNGKLSCETITINLSGIQPLYLHVMLFYGSAEISTATFTK